MEAGRLADEHQVGVGIAGTEDHLSAALGERALGAARNHLAERAKLVGPGQLSDRSHSFRRNSRRHS